IITDYIQQSLERERRNEKISYSKPVDDVIHEVLITHPEARLKIARKVLGWLVVAQYSETLRYMVRDRPEILAELLNNVPDFDTILRAMRDLQNTQGKYNDEQTNQLLIRHSRQVSE